MEICCQVTEREKLMSGDEKGTKIVTQRTDSGERWLPFVTIVRTCASQERRRSGGQGERQPRGILFQMTEE
jgi:hypothetical protein